MQLYIRNYLVSTGNLTVVVSSLLCCSLNNAVSCCEFFIVFTTEVHVLVVPSTDFIFVKSVYIKLSAWAKHPYVNTWGNVSVTIVHAHFMFAALSV